MSEDKAVISTADDCADKVRSAAEYELMRAVLNLAIKDACKTGRVGKEARDYLFSHDPSDEYLYSFESICSHLDVCADFIRQVVVSELAKS